MNKPRETSRVLGGRQIEVYPNLKRLMLLVGANDQANKEHRVLLAEIECAEQNYSILIEHLVLQEEEFQSAGWEKKFSESLYFSL